MKVRLLFVIISLACVALACLAYGFFIEPKRLVVRHVTVSSPHHVGEPVTIALLADIHIGGFHTPPKRIAKIVRATNALNPDFVLLAGDYIDGHKPRHSHSTPFNDSIEAGLTALGGLQAERGVIAVLGNHDNWYDGDFVQSKLTQAGMIVLHNEGFVKDTLCFVGMADYDTDRPTTEGYDICRENSSKIVLTHSPDAFSLLRSDTALAVAGHTHGGQINLPLVGRKVTSTRAGEPLAYGLKSRGDINLFITAGIGTSIMPARFRAPPEIVLITLSTRNSP